MRTCYEIEETDAYLAARELLVRRCGAWAGANGLAVSLPLAEALLDSRHFSSDGRLGYWTPAQVRRALLEWIPEKVSAPEEYLMHAPQTLRALLGYLDAHGLRDPRGAATGENEEAIDAAATQSGEAIGDRERYGMAKTAVMAARDRGVDIGDPEALASFLSDVGEGRVQFDEDLLGRALDRQLGRSAAGQERKFAQLPVRLPAPAELTAAAGRSKVVGQLRAFAAWLGPKGRALTPTENIGGKPARTQVHDHRSSARLATRWRWASAASTALRWARIGVRTGEPGNAGARLTLRSRRARPSWAEVIPAASCGRLLGMSDPGPLVLLTQNGVKAGLQPGPCRRDRVLPVKERDGAFKLALVVPKLVRGHGRKRMLRLCDRFGSHRQPLVT